MRFLVLFALLIVSTLCIPVGLKRLTGGFRLEKIKLDWPYHPEWETVLNSEIRAIFSQKFHYLSRGSQSYVFASEDGKYVIKFFRFDLHEPLLKSFLKEHSAPKLKTDLDAKVNHLFEACKMAYDRAMDETGIVYLHLNQTALDLPALFCKDALGRPYDLPLDRYRFVVQKKVETFSEAFEKAIGQGNPSAVPKWIDSIFELALSRSAKGLRNSDPNITRNIGFSNGKAVEIDFGNYCNCLGLSQPTLRIQEVRRFYRPLRRWLQERAPEWVSYLDERMEQTKREIER